MIAWMGHELKNVEQDVDLRALDTQPLKKLPLGSYVSDLIDFDYQSKEFQSGYSYK